MHEASDIPDIAYAAVTTIDRLYKPEAYLKTVNAKEAGMQEMIEMGVDGLMTHYPNRFSKRNAMK